MAGETQKMAAFLEASEARVSYFRAKLIKEWPKQYCCDKSNAHHILYIVCFSNYISPQNLKSLLHFVMEN